jgi:cyclic pyranopterin phosphate synthase
MAIDISHKDVIIREAIAEGKILLKTDTVNKIRSKSIEKGDVLELSKAVAVHSVKQTPNILIYCHPIPILSVKVNYELSDFYLKLEVYVKTEARTGCEIEALAGVSAGLLQIWDMVKMYEKDKDGQYPDTLLTEIRVTKKNKSSNFK